MAINKRSYPLFHVLSENGRSKIFCFLNENGESTFAQIYAHLTEKNLSGNNTSLQDAPTKSMTRESAVIKLNELNQAKLITIKQDPDHLRGRLCSINPTGLTNLNSEFAKMVGGNLL